MTSAMSMPSFQNYYGKVAIEANDGPYFFGNENVQVRKINQDVSDEQINTAISNNNLDEVILENSKGKFIIYGSEFDFLYPETNQQLKRPEKGDYIDYEGLKGNVVKTDYEFGEHGAAQVGKMAGYMTGTVAVVAVETAAYGSSFGGFMYGAFVGGPIGMAIGGLIGWGIAQAATDETQGDASKIEAISQPLKK